jgi:hypothetical protein
MEAEQVEKDAGHRADGAAVATGQAIAFRDKVCGRDQ